MEGLDTSEVGLAASSSLAPASPPARARVEAAARELDYRPSILASALSTGRTKLIGDDMSGTHIVGEDCFYQFSIGAEHDRRAEP